MQPYAVQPKYDALLRDESRLPGCADGVLLPRDETGAAGAFALAAKTRQALTLQGARTGQNGGAVPRGGLVVNFSGMNRLTGLTKAGDGFRLWAQGGATLEQIETFCARPTPGDGWPAPDVEAVAALKLAGRHYFPPNPTEKTATIGGVFANAATGPNHHFFGETSAFVQGLVWLAPKGAVWQFARGDFVFSADGCALPDGGFLQCSTALPRTPLPQCVPRQGMDLIDFLAGSEGKLGAALRLALQLRPLPQSNWGVLCFFETQQRALAFTDALRQWNAAAPGVLCAADYYDEHTLRLVDAARGANPALSALPPFPPGRRCAVCMELCGQDEDALQEHLLGLLEQIAACGAAEEDTWAAGSLAEMEKFRTLRHTIPELANNEVDRLRGELPQLLRLTANMAAPGKLYLPLFEEDIRQSDVRGCVYGSLLDGCLTAHLFPQNEAQLRRAEALLQQWAAQTVADGGNLAAVGGVGRVKAGLVARFLPPALAAHYAALKRQLDPGGTLPNFWAD